MKSQSLLLIIAILFQVNLFSQTFGMGGSALYNFQTESVGFELRAKKTYNNFSVVPELTYYPNLKNNKINEFIVGVGFNYDFYKYKSKVLYGIATFAYDAWINYAESNMQSPQYDNWNAELGFGLYHKSCLSPFVELRYNVRWQESTLRFGLIFYFNCIPKHRTKKHGLPKSNKKGSSIECPSF